MNIVKASKVRSEIEKFMLADGMDQVIDLEKSHGVWLADGRDGTEYLDLFSMFASMPVGYNCLLYTSLSPRDLSTSRMPSSA